MRSRDRLSFWEGNKTCFYNFFKYNGRARRSEFWNFVLLFQVNLIIYGLLTYIFLQENIIMIKNSNQVLPLLYY